MNPFDYLINCTKTCDKTVSMEEYDIFKREFVFDSLRGETFAEAFSSRFDINDFVLSCLVTENLAMKHIEDFYVR